MKPLLESRFALFLASILYAFSLEYCLSNYAAPKWAEYGYSYGGMDAIKYIYIWSIIGGWCLVFPKSLERPSSLFLLFTYLHVCIPAIVILAAAKDGLDFQTLLLILLLGIGLAGACIVTRFFRWREIGYLKELSEKNLRLIYIAGVLGLCALIYISKDVMSFSPLNAIYLQRAAGAAKGLFEGYLQTYFGYLVPNILLVYGLCRRNWLYIATGAAGNLVIYSIVATKNSIALLFVVPVIYYLMRQPVGFFRSTAFFLTAYAILILSSVWFADESVVANFVSWYLGVRTILTPGVSILNYYNFFSDHGYTYFNHISGVGALIPIDVPYTSDPRWPSIGLIVGEDYLQQDSLNSNANFIASDGVASLGLFGILAAFALYAIFLISLDRVSRGVRLAIIVPLLYPLAQTLTNGSLFTLMTSFGGFFYLVLFAVVFKRVQEKSQDVVSSARRV